MKIGIIGGGAMATAIITGLVANEVLPRENIYVSEHKKLRCQFLMAEFGIHADTKIDSFIDDADVIILAVKPQSAQQTITEIQPRLPEKTLLISIIAGMTLNSWEQSFPNNPIIRVMPNTPMAVGAGMSAITLGSKANKEHSNIALQIFGSAGKAILVDEHLMDTVSGLSGSGPAFVFVIIDALADAGVRGGLSRAAAIELAAQTVLGSAKMVLETGKHPAELRDMVTSPAGTTIEGIAVMEARGVRGAMIDTVKAAIEKSQSMGKK